MCEWPQTRWLETVALNLGSDLKSAFVPAQCHKKLPQMSARWAYLVVQWLRIHLAMQGFDSWSRKVPRAVGQLSVFHSYWSRAPRTCARQPEKPLQWGPHTATEGSPCSPQPEKARAPQQRPSTAQKKAACICDPTFCRLEGWPGSHQARDLGVGGAAFLSGGSEGRTHFLTFASFQRPPIFLGLQPLHLQH